MEFQPDAQTIIDVNLNTDQSTGPLSERDQLKPFLPLIITVENLKTLERTVYVYTESPVSVGRDEVSNLLLTEKFVSSQHAIIYFDRDNTRYFDANSRNGTWVNGKLIRNTSVEVGPNSELIIGSLRITLKREQAVAALQQKTSVRSSHQESAPLPKTRIASKPKPTAHIATPPPPDPALGNEALRLINAFAAFYLTKSQTFSTPASIVQFLDRVAQLLEAFGRSFVKLRKYYHEFAKEMGTGTEKHNHHLNHASDLHQVLTYLLDTNQNGVLKELQGDLDDLLIHQEALLRATIEGARAILRRLSPEAIAAAVKENSKNSSEFLLGIPLLRERALWKAYTARVRDLDEENSISTALFGPEFAQTYNIASKHRKED
jgi:predicted component of type VI protein secretion system